MSRTPPTVEELTTLAIDCGLNVADVGDYLLGCEYQEEFGYSYADVFAKAQRDWPDANEIEKRLYVMSQSNFRLPTYNPKAPKGGDDFIEPRVPVLVRQVDGIRVVLGSHDFGADKPDVLIERRKNGWSILIHPNGEHGDCVGCVFIHDDGRTWCVPDGLPRERIVVDEAWDSVSNEIDN